MWLWADPRSPRKSKILISCPQSSFDVVSGKSSCLCWCGGKQDAVKAEIFVDVFSCCSQCGALLLQGWGRAVLCSLGRQCSESRSQEIKQKDTQFKLWWHLTIRLTSSGTGWNICSLLSANQIKTRGTFQIKSLPEAHGKNESVGRTVDW